MKADYNVHPRSKIGLDYLGLDKNEEVYWNLNPQNSTNMPFFMGRQF